MGALAKMCTGDEEGVFVAEEVASARSLAVGALAKMFESLQYQDEWLQAVVVLADRVVMLADQTTLAGRTRARDTYESKYFWLGAALCIMKLDGIHDALECEAQELLQPLMKNAWLVAGRERDDLKECWTKVKLAERKIFMLTGGLLLPPVSSRRLPG